MTGSYTCLCVDVPRPNISSKPTTCTLEMLTSLICCVLCTNQLSNPDAGMDAHNHHGRPSPMHGCCIAGTGRSSMVLPKPCRLESSRRKSLAVLWQLEAPALPKKKRKVQGHPDDDPRKDGPTISLCGRRNARDVYYAHRYK